MEVEYGYTLEQSRNDQIKSLGFLCYNLYVDGSAVLPGADRTIEDIKNLLDNLFAMRQNNFRDDYLQHQESNLNEKLMELGCICYNLYVDNRLVNNEVLALCGDIASLNYEIQNGSKDSSQANNNRLPEIPDPPKPEIGPEILDPPKPEDSSENAVPGELNIFYPEGMEPIPTDFRRCSCGYRNRREARYCGKCGMKLS